MTFIVKCAPVIKECNFGCCSCNLRGAAVVVAWIITLSQVSALVTCFFYLNHFADQSPISNEITKVLIGLLGTFVGLLILDVLLLYGIHNKKSFYILPFLVCDLIGIMVLIALGFIVGIATIMNGWALHLFFLGILTFYVLLTAFFWIILYSYYRQMEEEKNPNSVGIVNCMYLMPNEQIQMFPEDGKVPSYVPNKLAPDMA